MVQGMSRHWISIVAIAFSTAVVTPGRSPNPDVVRAAELFQRADYAGAIYTLQTAGLSDTTGYALFGKACLMDGRYKEAIVSLEKAVAGDNLNSDYYDWLGKAYGRVAESSSALLAFGYARKTVHAFERAVELDPSNLEALGDLFEYCLDAPGIAGGGLDKAENVARRFAALDQAEYHWTCARIAEKRKEFVAAEREYRAALAAAPQQVGRVLDLATFLSSRGKYDESDALFRNLDHHHPNTPKVLYAQAAAYIRCKRHLDQAEVLLLRYTHLSTTPEDPSKQDVEKLLKSVSTVRVTARAAE